MCVLFYDINVEIKAEFQPNSLATTKARYHKFIAETPKEKSLGNEMRLARWHKQFAMVFVMRQLYMRHALGMTNIK